MSFAAGTLQIGTGGPRWRAGLADPSAGAGVPDALGTLWLRNAAGNVETWQKTGPADTDWTKLGARWSLLTTSGAEPSARAQMQSCYVPTLGGTIIFGGTVDFATAIDNTVYFLSDAGAWSTLATIGTPTRRFGGGMVYDSINDAVYLVGGYDAGYKDGATPSAVFVLDVPTLTWTDFTNVAFGPGEPGVFSTMCFGIVGGIGRTLSWNGNTPSTSPSDHSYSNLPAPIGDGPQGWALMPAPSLTGPGTGPSARNAVAIAFDAGRGVFVLTGGNTIPIDTWETPGLASVGAWTDVSGSIIGAPVPREGAYSAWSPRFGTLLFGGDIGALYIAVTQFYNGAEWKTPAPAVEPGPRGRGSCVWNSNKGRIEIFGGVTAGPIYNNETWVYG